MLWGGVEQIPFAAKFEKAEWLISNTTPPLLLSLYILFSRAAVVAQWLRQWTLNYEVPGSNRLAATVFPLGKVLYPHWLLHYKQYAFLLARLNVSTFI